MLIGCFVCLMCFFVWLFVFGELFCRCLLLAILLFNVFSVGLSVNCVAHVFVVTLVCCCSGLLCVVVVVFVCFVCAFLNTCLFCVLKHMSFLFPKPSRIVANVGSVFCAACVLALFVLYAVVLCALLLYLFCVCSICSK